jgi:D-glycero-D-manno-heptose 1,7-bisphosphate phosphatase
MELQKAIFLDRDGTVIQHEHYLTDANKVALAHGTPRALQLFKDAGYLLVVITNQSVIGRGDGTEEEVNACNRRMCDLLNEHELEFDGLYYCPHTPEDHCRCRKPKPGMLNQAAHDLHLDIGQCVMIGDNITDVEAGHNAGCIFSILIGEPPEGSSCLSCESLLESAELVFKMIELGGITRPHPDIED